MTIAVISNTYEKAIAELITLFEKSNVKYRKIDERIFISDDLDIFYVPSAQCPDTQIDQIILCTDICGDGYMGGYATYAFGLMSKYMCEHSCVPEEFQIIRLEK